MQKHTQKVLVIFHSLTHYFVPQINKYFGFSQILEQILFKTVFIFFFRPNQIKFFTQIHQFFAHADIKLLSQCIAWIFIFITGKPRTN